MLDGIRITPDGHYFNYLGKSYFMYGSVQEAEMLQTFTQEIKQDGCTIVEIGSGQGGSSIIFLESLSQINGLIYTVDIGKIPITFPDDRIKIINEPSLQAVEMFDDNSLDLVFIDASHTYENVIADLTAWFPKVRKGGIFCGHDCMEYYNKFTNVQQSQLRQNKSNEIWTIPNPQEWEILNSQWKKSIELQSPLMLHPGVVCAIYDFFQGDFTLFPDKSTIWRVNKT